MVNNALASLDKAVSIAKKGWLNSIQGEGGKESLPQAFLYISTPTKVVSFANTDLESFLSTVQELIKTGHNLHEFAGSLATLANIILQKDFSQIDSNKAAMLAADSALGALLHTPTGRELINSLSAELKSFSFFMVLHPAGDGNFNIQPCISDDTEVLSPDEILKRIQTLQQ